MARGLGAFFSGIAEGYQTGKKINSMEAAEEREKARLQIERDRAALDERRLTIDENRDKRDLEKWGLDKQEVQQRLDSGAIELSQKKRDDDFQKNQSKRLAELVTQSRGGVQLDVIDPNGKLVGPMTYSSMEEATKDLQTKGLTFKPGSAKQITPLDQVDLEMRAADIMLEEALRAGKVTPELLTQARKRRKDAEREGAIEAMRYFHTTKDEVGAKKMFNKNGKIKIGDDVRLDFKPGMFGPTIYGYRVGKDGKREEVFDGFRDIILPSMGPEAYATTMASFRQTEVKETGDNNRAAAANKTAITTTGMNNRATIAASLNRQDGKNPVMEGLKDLILDPAGKVMSNPNFAISPEIRQQATLDTLEKAEFLYYEAQRIGKPISLIQASADAMRLVEEQLKKNQGRR